MIILLALPQVYLMHIEQRVFKALILLLYCFIHSNLHTECKSAGCTTAQGHLPIKPMSP